MKFYVGQSNLIAGRGKQKMEESRSLFFTGVMIPSLEGKEASFQKGGDRRGEESSVMVFRWVSLAGTIHYLASDEIRKNMDRVGHFFRPNSSERSIQYYIQPEASYSVSPFIRVSSVAEPGEGLRPCEMPN